MKAHRRSALFARSRKHETLLSSKCSFLSARWEIIFADKGRSTKVVQSTPGAIECFLRFYYLLSSLRRLPLCRLEKPQFVLCEYLINWFVHGESFLSFFYYTFPGIYFQHSSQSTWLIIEKSNFSWIFYFTFSSSVHWFSTSFHRLISIFKIISSRQLHLKMLPIIIFQLWPKDNSNWFICLHLRCNSTLDSRLLSFFRLN